MRSVAFDLLCCAGDDVEAEILGKELMSEAGEHLPVPGQDGGDEDSGAQDEGGAELLEFPALEDGDEKGGERDGDGGGALGHHGDGEADPEEVPAVAVFGFNLREADEGENGSKREERIHLADVTDVEEAEGGEEDDGA
jgi:hypothetical protein